MRGGDSAGLRLPLRLWFRAQVVVVAAVVPVEG